MVVEQSQLLPCQRVGHLGCLLRAPEGGVLDSRANSSVRPQFCFELYCKASGARATSSCRAWRVVLCTGKLFGLMAEALPGGEDLLCWYSEF